MPVEIDCDHSLPFSRKRERQRRILVCTGSTHGKGRIIGVLKKKRFVNIQQLRVEFEC